MPLTLIIVEDDGITALRFTFGEYTSSHIPNTALPQGQYSNMLGHCCTHSEGSEDLGSPLGAVRSKCNYKSLNMMFINQYICKLRVYTSATHLTETELKHMLQHK